MSKYFHFIFAGRRPCAINLYPPFYMEAQNNKIINDVTQSCIHIHKSSTFKISCF